uniref:Uncharacterized protein n=1 Tax=Panagrolaimus davidi TaxID=227884 RepID=A0A914Q0T5_9BILA
MKLLFVLGICLILCIQISHQLPFGGGTKDRKYPGRYGNSVIKPIHRDNNKIWKNHGIREAGEQGDDTEGNNKDEGHPLIGVPSDFDIETDINPDSADTGTKLETEKDIQKVKRGWFKNLWKTIKNVLVGSLFGMIKRSTNDQPPIENIDELDSEDFDNVLLSDDIIEVNIGSGTSPEDKAETEKEIQIVKRGWFKKIRRKIKNVFTGAVVGSVVGSVVKRNNKNDENEEILKVKGNLPLLLKTLRLRPGTADEITEIVEKLGNNLEFQDAMINEILDESNEKDDEIVLERSGKMVVTTPKCVFKGGRIRCTWK